MGEVRDVLKDEERRTENNGRIKEQKSEHSFDCCAFSASAPLFSGPPIAALERKR